MKITAKKFYILIKNFDLFYIKYAGYALTYIVLLGIRFYLTRGSFEISTPFASLIDIWYDRDSTFGKSCGVSVLFGLIRLSVAEYIISLYLFGLIIKIVLENER